MHMSTSTSPTSTQQQQPPPQPPQDLTFGPPSAQWHYSPPTKTYDLTRGLTPKFKIQTTEGPEAWIQVATGVSALVVVDMQNFFLSEECRQHPLGLAAIEPTIRVIERCREVGIQIIWLNWGLTETDMATMPAGVQRGFSRSLIAQSTSSTTSTQIPTPTTQIQVPTPTTRIQVPTPTTQIQIPTPTTRIQIPTPTTRIQVPTPTTRIQVPTPTTRIQVPTPTTQIPTPTTQIQIPTPTTRIQVPTPTTRIQIPTPTTQVQVPTTTSQTQPLKAGLGADLGSNKGRTLFANTWNADIYPPLKAHVQPEDIHCGKNRMSGLWCEEQPLWRYLSGASGVSRNSASGNGTSGNGEKGRRKETLFFTGVNTDQCVLGTLSDAYNAGWDCVMINDCCATTTEKGKEVCVHNVSNSYGFVVESDTFCAGILS